MMATMTAGGGSFMNYQAAALTIRGLAMDGVEKAKSGHPGMPMGTADYASVLFLRTLKYHPADPAWPDRDRFVLSAGHGSMLMYSLLHLAGYGLSLDELRNFRQFGSRTPGHPEHGLTPGVETTTGPLGQGCGNAVGMAIAEQMQAARFNREGFPLVSHRTFVIAGDGDMMEGLSHEAFSLAGHLKLSKLVVFYDFNNITIEGNTSLACSDQVRLRFEAYGWNVIEIDGHDYAQIEAALDQATTPGNRPTLIIGHTRIGKGAAHLEGSHETHGAPLGAAEIRATKTALGLPPDQEFYVSEETRALFAARAAQGAAACDEWKRLWGRYRKAHPELAAQWTRDLKGELPETMDSALPKFDPAKPIATRSASGQTLQALAAVLPSLVGGSADLAPSNNTYLKNGGDIGPGAFSGRNFHFGIREHAMASVMNGVALHGGFRIFGGTFLVFADYARPSIRLAALMKLPVVYVFTHDSFCVGEDGPTHQPVEQAASLRIIPGLSVVRPADATETAAAWSAVMKNTRGPSALLLTRHNLPVMDRAVLPAAANVEKGGYTLWESRPGEKPALILIASGSEVSIALDAAKKLAESGKAIRVVSMPCQEWFDAQKASYRKSVLPPACKARVVIEAGVRTGWEKYGGNKGLYITMDRFGESAPYTTLLEHFGFTAAQVAERSQSLL